MNQFQIPGELTCLRPQKENPPFPHPTQNLLLLLTKYGPPLGGEGAPFLKFWGGMLGNGAVLWRRIYPQHWIKIENTHVLYTYDILLFMMRYIYIYEKANNNTNTTARLLSNFYVIDYYTINICHFQANLLILF